jgi:predicted AAA+ superfamily ATPase
MTYIKHILIDPIIETLKREKSIFLLGARQTGKTTLVKFIPHDRYINLMDQVKYPLKLNGSMPTRG